MTTPPKSGHLRIADSFYQTRRCPLFRGVTVLYLTTDQLIRVKKIKSKQKNEAAEHVTSFHCRQNGTDFSLISKVYLFQHRFLRSQGCVRSLISNLVIESSRLNKMTSTNP